MNIEINKSRILSGMLWKLMERGGTQGIQFIVQIILARLLLPSDYGIIALVIIFTSIAGAFVQGGLNTALIQKKDANEDDFSSVFYLSLFIAFLIYIILFLTAPSIASFFGEPKITSVFRVLSITLFFGAFNSIQNAIVARNLQFKKLFLSSTGAIIVSGTLGIYMAYAGFGVWALVVQQISNQLIVTLILWYMVKWRPQLVFSVKKINNLFSFGWKILLSSLINILFVNLRSLIIGKTYTAEMLGFYNRGQQFPALIINNISGSIQSVMLPVLSSQQDNIPRVKDMARRSIVTSSFIVFPIMIGLAVTAEPLVKILLTNKWIDCVPFLQIYCVTYIMRPLNMTNLQVINALGRSDISLKLEVLKKILDIAILFVTIFYGVYAIALGGAISALIATAFNAYPNKKLLKYGYIEQLKDIAPSLLLSFVMGAVVYSIQLMGMTTLATLIIQVSVGLILYVGLAYVFRLECLNYLLQTFKELKQ